MLSEEVGRAYAACNTWGGATAISEVMEPRSTATPNDVGSGATDNCRSEPDDGQWRVTPWTATTDMYSVQYVRAMDAGVHKNCTLPVENPEHDDHTYQVRREWDVPHCLKPLASDGQRLSQTLGMEIERRHVPTMHVHTCETLEGAVWFPLCPYYYVCGT